MAKKRKPNAAFMKPMTPSAALAEVVGSKAIQSEEHTSELQSPCNLVCRLLLEKKKKHCHACSGHFASTPGFSCRAAFLARRISQKLPVDAHLPPCRLRTTSPYRPGPRESAAVH